LGGFGEDGHRLGVGDSAVATVVLCFVEGFVGSAEKRQRSGVGNIVGAGGADASCDVEAADGGIESAPANEVDDALGVFGGAGSIATGQNGEKFFAAVASDTVIGAASAGETKGELADDLIADGVAVGIVDGFEVIDIEDHDTDGRVLALGAGKLAAEHIVDGGAIQDAGESIVSGGELEAFAGFEEIILEFEDAEADAETGAELACVQGLGKVIVGSGVEAANDIFFIAAAGDENEIGVGSRDALANHVADFRAIVTGHHPIEDSNARRIVRIQDFPGCFAVFGDDEGVAILSEIELKETASDRVVIGDENLHRFCPSGQRASS
jgi:hypothetical protein